MRTLRATTRYEKDLKKLFKGKSKKQRDALEDRLGSILKTLQADQSLPRNHHDHKLTGNWGGYRACHVWPDLILIYALEGGDTLWLVRLGAHSDLYG